MLLRLIDQRFLSLRTGSLPSCTLIKSSPLLQHQNCFPSRPGALSLTLHEETWWNSSAGRGTQQSFHLQGHRLHLSLQISLLNHKAGSFLTPQPPSFWSWDQHLRTGRDDPVCLWSHDLHGLTSVHFQSTAPFLCCQTLGHLSSESFYLS